MTISKQEVLRYLGYKGSTIPDNLDKIINNCIEISEETINPKYVFEPFLLQQSDEGLLLPKPGILLTGNDIRNHLANCREIYLLAVTIGINADRLIRLKMVTAPEEGVIFNSAFSVAIEMFAEKINQEICIECNNRNLNTTWRYSPGYGDLPLNSQKDILNALDAQNKIGLTVTDSLILTPTKSITAIIGVSDTTQDKRINKCDYCRNYENCEFRKSGKKC